jgi:hypothetical protein
MTVRPACRLAAGVVALAFAGAAPLVAQTAQPMPMPNPGSQGRAPQAQASPRDTAEATVGGARVMVDYSRPSKRGRTIFGGLVPYGQVWRTGANSATTLVTGAALKMGSTTVPAGTYTLYTIPTASGWTLIVNKQTGQWGTEYDQKQDLARIPMKAARTTAPVEQFTIDVQPRGQGAGLLSFAWDTARAELPFTASR